MNAVLSPERMKAESELRVRRALQRIQRAQDELDGACNELSALCGGFTTYRATQSLRERVHQHWYKVQAFLHRGKFHLDGTNIDALLKRDAAVQS